MVVEKAIGDGVTFFVCFLVDEDFVEDLFVVEIDNVLFVFVVLGFLLALVTDFILVVVVVVVVSAVIFLFSFVLLFNDDDCCSCSLLLLLSLRLRALRRGLFEIESS